MADATRYYYSPEEIDRASSVTVLDYLLSGKGAYTAYETGKFDSKTGEPIYTCDYDGQRHDTVKITSQGFKHWASNRKGCFYAYEFLRDYCGYSDMSKLDKMKIYEEIFLAVFSALSFTMKLPKPLKYTFSSSDKEALTLLMKASTMVCTAFFSIPVLLEISFTISAFVIIILFVWVND